jgi:hypothetical protein
VFESIFDSVINDGSMTYIYIYIHTPHTHTQIKFEQKLTHHEMFLGEIVERKIDL